MQKAVPVFQVLVTMKSEHMKRSSVRPARSASSILLSSFEQQSLASYPPKLPHASQVIHCLLCLRPPRAVQKLRHVGRMPWLKMYHLHRLSNGVYEGILPSWIVVHWVFQKIDLPRCELFIGEQRGAFWSRAYLDGSFRNTGQVFVPSWSMRMGSRSFVLYSSEVAIFFELQCLFFVH